MTLYFDGIEGTRGQPGERVCVEHPGSLNQWVGLLISLAQDPENNKIELELDDGSIVSITTKSDALIRVKKAREDDYHPRVSPAIALRLTLDAMSWELMDLRQDIEAGQAFGAPLPLDEIVDRIHGIGEYPHADKPRLDRDHYNKEVGAGWQ